MKRRTNPDPRGHTDGRTHMRTFAHAARILEGRSMIRQTEHGRQFFIHFRNLDGITTSTVTFKYMRGFRVFGSSIFAKARTRDLALRLAGYRRDLNKYQQTSNLPLDFRSLTQLTAALSYDPSSS